MSDTSVYPRKGSPKWYVSYFCPRRLKRVHEATPWRTDDPTGLKHAARFAAEKEQQAIAFRGVSKHEVWSAWVENFLDDRYRSSPKTLTRYKNAWDWLRVFLQEQDMHLPEALNYNHVIAYVHWRTKKKRKCGKPIKWNTALMEVKILGVIMREAIRRGFATSNPCDRLGLQREPAQVKPELTETEIDLIRKECAERESKLPLVDQWMTTSFEIALHSLCRLSSTQIPLTSIDFTAAEMILRVKGRRLGEPRFLTVPIHPDLMPRLLALRAGGATYTCVLPRMAAKEWWALRKKLKISHTTFHSTRVTGISRLCRSGVPESVTMRLAGHNSPAVSRIYQRHRTEDLARHLNVLKFAPAAPLPVSSRDPLPASRTVASPQNQDEHAASA
jgi:hypothetical protein